MANQSSEQILKSIDSVLSKMKWKGPPSDVSHLYSPQHLEHFKNLGNQESITSERIIAHALKLNKNTLRICSIGCEDGTIDRLILEGLTNVNVEYVGLDSDDVAVEEAKEKLKGISPTFKIHTIAVDYEEANELEAQVLEPFDLVWMVNCAYCTLSLTPLLQGALKLLKASGVMLIISTSSQQSLEQLVTRFWYHQHQQTLHTTESVVKTLTEFGVAHQVYSKPVTFDLTTQFRDGFKSAASELVLDQLVFCRLTDYPPEMKKFVIEFLKCIAQISDNSCKIISLSDLVHVTN